MAYIGHARLRAQTHTNMNMSSPPSKPTLELAPTLPPATPKLQLRQFLLEVPWHTLFCATVGGASLLSLLQLPLMFRDPHDGGAHNTQNHSP